MASMERAECRVLVFAKAPIPGKVKTRLASSLGLLRAAALHKSLALHCLETAVASAVGPVELWCAPSVEHPFFEECSRQFRVKCVQQADGDVGRRMAHAFEEALRDASYVLLMGTDCPSLTASDLIEGCSLLKRGSDAVLSPAADGGYVLIGLRRYAPELFTGISWGTESVMDETRMRLRELRWQWHELPTRWDVDRPEDMEHLIHEGYAHLIPFPFDPSIGMRSASPVRQ
jgi:hypothetical protein